MLHIMTEILFTLLGTISKSKDNDKCVPRNVILHHSNNGWFDANHIHTLTRVHLYVTSPPKADLNFLTPFT